MPIVIGISSFKRGDGMIESTININISVLKKLTKASDATGLSIQQIISWVLKRFADEVEVPLVSWSRIRYQDRDIKENWHRLHVVFSPAEYELLLDLKKACKLSGSKIVAHTIEKYLYVLLGAIKKYSDNYRVANYSLLYGTVDGVAYCMQFWGIPQEPHKYIRLFT